MSVEDMCLRQGSTVAVIGGGPGGTSAAIALLQRARARGLTLRVVIFEGKYFKVHHNQCAGVLSPPLEQVLKDGLGLSLPPGLVKRRVYGYRLHAGGEEIFLVGSESATYTVLRAQFDRFMLGAAMEAGAEVIQCRVTGLEFVGRPHVREVRVYAESGYLRADAVICAFGMDEGLLGALEQATAKTVRYRRPGAFLRTFVTKLQTPPGFIEQHIGNSIRAYLMPPEIPNVEFGAISPKDQHVVINIAGGSLTSEDLDRFLDLPCVRQYLPEFQQSDLAYFEGRFPTAPARNCYGDRFVVVGDATGWLRPFKGKGITTAMTTGIRAAETMLEHGVSARSFRHYGKACRELLADYSFGVLVRTFCGLGRRLGVFRPMLNLARRDEVIFEALYDSVSGHDSYRNIIARLLRPAHLARVAGQLLGGSRPTRKEKGMSKNGGPPDVEIRQLTARDIEAIMAIDQEITGHPSTAYWESKLASNMERDPNGCLAAEIDGEVVGFVLGDIRGWEFNTPLSGWIDIVGVSPRAQGQGVGRRLVEALFEHFRKAGIAQVNMLIDLNDAELVEYFRAIGFQTGGFVHLQRTLDSGAGAAEPRTTGEAAGVARQP